ncbi:MAG: hypothetical protein CME71_06090 [Halobacteriovorax sp.]|nr:hypothetical protein [Halobacteriovorax sp.]
MNSRNSIFLVLLLGIISSAAVATDFVIAVGESQLQIHPRVESYLHEVILPIYRKVGLKPKLVILPMARLRILQDKGEIDAVGGSIYNPAIEKNYLPISTPITDEVSINLYRLPKLGTKELNVAFVKGETGINLYKQKYGAIKTKFHEVRNREILFSMMKLKRVDAMVTGNFSVETHFSPAEYKSLEIEQLQRVTVSHYVNRKHSEIHKKLESEIKKLDQKKKFRLFHFIKNEK